MALAAADSVWFNPIAAGAGDFVVASALPGYRTPAQAAIPNGATIHYTARTATEFENGEGVYSSGSVTLSRVTIFASSNANAKVTFASVPTVAITPLAEDVIFPPASSTDGELVVWSGTGADTIKNTLWIIDSNGNLTNAASDFIDQTFTASGPGVEYAHHIFWQTASTSSPSGYEKIAVFIDARTSDPSDYGASPNINRDTVGIDSRGIIQAGNATGRAWGAFLKGKIESGADGYAVGAEISIENNGSDVATSDSRFQKVGIHLNSTGSVNSTAAILMTNDLSPFHSGIYAEAGTFADYFLRFVDRFEVDTLGNLALGAAPGYVVKIKDTPGPTPTSQLAFYVNGDTTSIGTTTNHNFGFFANDSQNYLEINKGQYVLVKNGAWFGIANAGGIALAPCHVEFNGSAGAVDEILRITSTTAGVPAVGRGAAIRFELETSASNNEIGGAVQAVMESGTATAERIVVQARQMAAGALQDAQGLTWFVRSLTANAAYTNNNSAQPWFPTSGAISVKAATTYEFEGCLLLTTGATSHTVGLSFGGTATLTSIGYEAMGGTAVINATATNFSLAQINQAANTVVTPASTTTGNQIWVRGVIRVNAAGTLIPQFQFSAAPGAGNVLANSFFKLREFGSNTNTAQGAWA